MPIIVNKQMYSCLQEQSAVYKSVFLGGYFFLNSRSKRLTRFTRNVQAAGFENLIFKLMSHTQDQSSILCSLSWNLKEINILRCCTTYKIQCVSNMMTPILTRNSLKINFAPSVQEAFRRVNCTCCIFEKLPRNHPELLKLIDINIEYLNFND